jgi:signal transduction histidine kinase
MQVEALRISDQLKTDFVSSVSHELRTPLASIIGYVDVMLDGDVGTFTDEQREFMSIVHENARRLLTLINDLLTLSGVESGKMVLRRELTDLRGVVERCVRDQLQVAEASDLRLSLVLPADPVEAQVDADRIGQVLTNLLANAIKFTGAGGRVGVALGRARNGVALSVSDTGIGIAEDDQTRLFERFFRARNAADNSIPGTGLGLAISKGIVDAHGGTLTVESALDEGTAITVLLPTDPVPRTPTTSPKEIPHVRV